MHKKFAALGLAALIFLAAPKAAAQCVAATHSPKRAVPATSVGGRIPFRAHLVVHPGPENMVPLQIPKGFTLVIEHVGFGSPATTQMPLPEIKISDSTGTIRHSIPAHFAGFDASTRMQQWVGAIEMDVALAQEQRTAMVGDFSPSNTRVIESFDISGYLLESSTVIDFPELKPSPAFRAMRRR